jgi:hypothetical protein
MKIFILFIILIANLQSQPRALTSKDAAVLIDAQVELGATNKVILSWNKNELAIQYGIFRKELGQTFTGEPLIVLDSSITTYVDETIEIGKIYEYRIVANSLVGLNSQGGLVSVNYHASGYKAVSVSAPAYSGGRLLLLIDETMDEPLKNEIDRLENDLYREGWTIVKKYVVRSESFDGDKVKQVKQIILDEYAKMPFDHIFLLGRVPVPYSGDIVPDGHVDNHRGAWPADIYYGSINEAIWTDSFVNSTSAPERTQNVPGDGKFDISTLYNPNNWALTVQTHASVGRVDMYNLPAFQKSEVELLKSYLDKNHKFRTGQFDIEKRGLVDNNFNAAQIPAAFAWSGWANFGSVIGRENVVSGDWIKGNPNENLQDKTYLMAYGDGPGSYTSVGGVGNTDNFVNNQLNAVFTMLFGSYFGDWDVRNNVMRAALASEPSILSCSWAGRPHWYYHHLGLDFPLGYSAKVTLNNVIDYLPPLIIQNNQQSFPEGLLLQIHTSLLADPTLKVNPNPDVEHLDNLSAIDENDDTKITWDMPSSSSGNWDIYFTVDKSEKWHKANSEPITTNEFYHDFKFDGEITYLVREIISENDPLSPSIHGILNRYSRGNITTIIRTDVNSIETISDEINLILSPNPAIDYVNINFKTNTGTATLKIYDIHGNLIKQFDYQNIGNATNQLVWNLNGEKGNLINGFYIVQLVNNGNITTEKLIIKR